MKRKYIAIAAFMLIMPLIAGAHTLKGSYFMDNSLNRHKMNPAFAPHSGYFQIPVIGNISAGALSNMNLQTFIYPMNGQLYTFMHKNVAFADLDRNLAKHPHIDAVSNVNLIDFGWKTKAGSFWTVDIGAKAMVDVDVPRELFLFAKKGIGAPGTAYELGQIKANAFAALQASLGYSRDLSSLVDGLRVGVKARVILPVAYAGVDLDKVDLETEEDHWAVQTKGSVVAAGKGLEMMGPDGSFSPSFSGIHFSDFGYSFDLGAEYKLDFEGFINGVSFSAAVTDLGLIHYGKQAVKVYEAGGDLEWTGFRISMEEDAMQKSFEELESQASELLSLKEAKATSITRSTLPSFYLGVEMPFLNNKMSIGALYSARKSYNFTRNELTLSYNLTPAKWFSLGLNYSFLNVAKTLGWILELTPAAGPSLFLGSDYTFMEFAKIPSGSMIPTSWRFNFHFGLAFTLGGKNKE